MTTGERFGHHELAAQQADAVDIERRDLLGPIGDRQVDVQPGGEGLGTRRHGRRAALDRRGDGDVLFAGEHHAATGIDRDHVAGAQVGGGRSCADDGGQAQLTADDRCMAGAPTGIGDERRGTAHGRHPVGRCHLGHQHVTVGQEVAVGRRGEDPHRTAPGAGTDAQAAKQRLVVDLRLHVERRDRPRLHDVQAVADVRPLDVLWDAVVPLDVEPDRCHGPDLVVGQHPPPGFAPLHDLVTIAVRTAHDPRRLVADPDLADTHRLPIDAVGVGLDGAGHDDLTQPEGPLDHHLIAAGRISGEHDTRSVRADHLLDDHGDRRLVGQPAFGSIGHDTLAEQRDPTVDQTIEQIGGGDVGERLVHPCEGRLSGVLGRCGRSHRDRHATAMGCVHTRHLGDEVIGQRHLAQQVAGRARQFGQLTDVRRCRGSGDVGQTLPDPRLADHPPVRGRGDDETVGDGKATGEHLSEVGALAPDEQDIGRADRGERNRRGRGGTRRVGRGNYLRVGGRHDQILS